MNIVALRMSAIASIGQQGQLRTEVVQHKSHLTQSDLKILQV
ncbi:hypothetical protein [Leptolyngbya sp. FACHB-541]|nr:hypothetical protein [Leptolyngbya sp. FACHB-541]